MLSTPQLALALAFAFTPVSALLACAPSTSSSTPATRTTAEPSASADDGLAPVEVEPPAGDDAGPDPAASARDAAEHFEHGAVVLGLDPATCLLVAETDAVRVEHRFAFPAPCHFANRDGSVHAVETDSGLAIVVESSQALDSSDSSKGCDTALRVVVLTAKGPRLSRAAQHVAMCAEAAGGSPGQWDEMMFHVLASDSVEFGTPAQDP